MGVNPVTGDYSRGASGFWIENGRLTYPVSEVTIAGNLIAMFRCARARQRSRVPLRHQCADGARGGSDRCRTLTASLSTLAPRALRRRLRDAGDVALKTFRQPLRQWIKGKSSPVSEADIAVDEFLRERLLGLAAGYGWLSEETEDDPARLEAENVWIVDPIDGTRAYLAGQADWTISVALAVARPADRSAAIFAPVIEELFLAVVGRGATRNGAPIAASAGDRL